LAGKAARTLIRYGLASVIIFTMHRRRKLSGVADEELMLLVARRDHSAFGVLYDRHGTACYSLAHRILGDRQRAEDVVQETFLSIWRSQSSYDPGRGSVRNWLLAALRNRAIDAIRREAARPAPARGVDPAEVLAGQPSGADTGATVIHRETSRTLRGILGGLPQKQSQVIELAYFGGFTHTEIAEMLGAPVGTVKGRMRLGLEKIRAAMAEPQS
jgi:RNA polymerase sigma-70 factor (ECF subfamily)